MNWNDPRPFNRPRLMNVRLMPADDIRRAARLLRAAHAAEFDVAPLSMPPCLIPTMIDTDFSPFLPIKQLQSSMNVHPGRKN